MQVVINYSSAGKKSRPPSGCSRVISHLEEENITARIPAATDDANETYHELTYRIVDATAVTKRTQFWAGGGEYQTC